jgi:hypothetical protein
MFKLYTLLCACLVGRMIATSLTGFISQTRDFNTKFVSPYFFYFILFQKKKKFNFLTNTDCLLELSKPCRCRKIVFLFLFCVCIGNNFNRLTSPCLIMHVIIITCIIRQLLITLSITLQLATCVANMRSEMRFFK